jgi:hypothetical protein
LPSKYFIGVPFAISLIFFFVLYVFLDSKAHLVKYKNIIAIAIFMSYKSERLWNVMVGGNFY